MAWDHLSINRPHLVYVILGGFTTLFMLCSSVIKERLYIGEATVATICGIIFGPHAANLIDPSTWGNVDQFTLEFSRIVLVVQCFAIGVELPKAYMERHWRSVVFLLLPVMTYGWLITSLFIWWMVPTLSWLDSLCCAACVTATDPVLASSVVGKGKFAKRVPKHLRDLLSAESGCNDGMAFPFVYLAVYLIRYRPDAAKVSYYWFLYTILYECLFGAIYGVVVGYAARRAIRYAHEKNWVDRESFLVFYFVLSLFCAGSGSILGLDDLLVGFAAGVGFSNDGWFTEKTEESHVSNVIDLLINLAFFVYFGTIIPWDQFNAPVIGLSPWRLVVIAIMVLFFRRIPIMLTLKPFIPDVKTWREALFAGHFGPIGVGGLFVAILARAELSTESTTPLAVLPEPGFPYLNTIEVIWPLTTFLVIASILVHGSSIAVFTLGKHINTLTITMSYTQGADQGPSWMDRLPRIQSRSKSSMRGEESFVDEKMEYPEASLEPGTFLRKQASNSTPMRAQHLRPPRRGRKWDSTGYGPGGPISESAIAPQRRNQDHSDVPSPNRSDSDTLAINKSSRGSPDESLEKKHPAQVPEQEIYIEGNDLIMEDEEGNVLKVLNEKGETKGEIEEDIRRETGKKMVEQDIQGGVSQIQDPQDTDEGTKVADALHNPRKAWKRKLSGYAHGRKRADSGGSNASDEEKKKERKRVPAFAYQFGHTIIVEDENGEVLKKYDIPASERPGNDRKTSYVDPEKTRQRLAKMRSWLGVNPKEAAEAADQAGSSSRPTTGRAKAGNNEWDDNHIRFSTATGDRRMSKAEFIQQIKDLNPKARANIVSNTNAPESIKEELRQDAREHTKNKKKVENAPHAGTARPSVQGMPSEEQIRGANAALKKTDSNEDRPRGPEGLTLVDSNGQDIPVHSISGDFERFSTPQAGQGDTAAQRRRRLMQRQRQRPQQPPISEDSDDDGTERMPPIRVRHALPESPPPTVGQHVEDDDDDDEAETAAEKKRRLGALGHTHEESTSSEDEDTSGESKDNSARGLSVRFAEDTVPKTTGNRLRWGDDVGRRPD